MISRNTDNSVLTNEPHGTPRPRGDTRLKLITAAEKLFGEKGIHGVTLKEINAAAGQRNESALHYHFGSKSALVEAILLQRATYIDEVRQERVEALLKAGNEGDLSAVLRATFLPMTDLLAHEDGVRFVRFLAQVLNDPDFDLPDMATRGKLPGVTQANALLIAALGDIAPEIAIQRQRFLIEMMINSLATWTQHHDPVEETMARELFVANLFDSIEGFLTAPVSEETLELLKKALRRKEKK
jgi:AcrR family transcriptional regulator